MPRTVKPLNAVTINAAKPNNGKIRKLFDGNGLQLWVMPDGAKYWRADFRIDGKRKDFAIGAYPGSAWLKPERPLSRHGLWQQQEPIPSLTEKLRKLRDSMQPNTPLEL